MVSAQYNLRLRETVPDSGKRHLQWRGHAGLVKRVKNLNASFW